MIPVIIGAGLAGLSAALSLAPRPVILLSAAKLGEQCSSAWAQGGIAAALGPDDTPALHAADTMEAGAGGCDAAIVRQVTEDGAAVIARLIARGVGFDRDEAGHLRLGLEAAHRHRRIVHAADATGAAIMRALTGLARRTPSITIFNDARAVRLLTRDGAIAGVVIERGDRREVLATDSVVLATGGAGALWQHTTNPLSSWGQGLALAARAGASFCDLEYMQFHPTAIDAGLDPMPLASEALRGEGAVLIDERGERFMAGYARGDLEPRDVVTRAIWAQMDQGHRVFLDARQAIGAAFPVRFPGIDALCRKSGIDPVTMPIPVRPAAHYHMGGVMTDGWGRTDVAGLWACGEVARTGLHGANRLASNSLLEAASFGQRVAEDILGSANKNKWPPRLRGGDSSFTGTFPAETTSCPRRRASPFSSFSPLEMTDGDLLQQGAFIRALMSAHVGVLRDKVGLEKAIGALTPLAAGSDMALSALMIATAALRRTESRGAHARTDFPATVMGQAQSRILKLADLDRAGADLFRAA